MSFKCKVCLFSGPPTPRTSVPISSLVRSRVPNAELLGDQREGEGSEPNGPPAPGSPKTSQSNEVPPCHLQNPETSFKKSKLCTYSTGPEKLS